MDKKHKEIFQKLSAIYKRHRKKYPGNPDSNQMCCMWSTSDPPDIIEDTDPIYDLEKTFDISIDDDQCIELYDMNIEEAVVKIYQIMQEKC